MGKSKGAPPAGQKAPNTGLVGPISGEVVNLDSDKVDVVIRAAAALSLVAQRDDCPPEITDAAPKLVLVLSSASDLIVQRNCAAALTSIMSASEAGWRRVVESGAAAALVATLGKAEDGPLLVNCCESLGVLSTLGDEGTEAAVAAGGVDAVCAQLGKAEEAGVAEAVADVVCALAASETVRPRLVAAGAVEGLGGLLGSGSPEVTVRALLGLGMVLGSSQEAQLKLAALPGAVGRLVQLMRSDDGDAKVVASGLFAGLAKNEGCRTAVEAALRGAADGGGAGGGGGGAGEEENVYL